MPDTKTLPWYQSQVLQAQIAQMIIVLLGLLGIVTDIDWNVFVSSFFVLAQGGVAIWTAIARIRKANPPITETAVLAEEQFQAEPQR
jgi:hypothetical protein